MGISWRKIGKVALIVLGIPIVLYIVVSVVVISFIRFAPI